MSMLAGPKRKQKWTLNPRGKHWSEDSNKFGQKMLEKMGWSSGKGLGAREQGIVDHIRVKVKNDQVGIGFDKNQDDQWTEHQENFNDFLQNLQKQQSSQCEEVKNVEESIQVLSGKSLEEKSKQSQKRVHYKKFTRGKDVNKYSTKDLANIFGKKHLDERPKKKVKEQEEEKVQDPVGAKDTTAGILTIKGGNINDYFKNKFQLSESASQDRENSGSELEQRAGFGSSSAKSRSKFYLDGDNSLNIDESNGDAGKYAGFGFTKSSEAKSKSKKHNNLNYVFDNPCLDLNILDSPVQKRIEVASDYVDCSAITPKKRKKEFVYENEALDLECSEPTPKKKKDSILSDNVNEEYLEKVTPKKSKKLKNEQVECYENPALDLEVMDMTPVSDKKIKRQPTLNGLENLGLDLNFSDTPTPKKVRKIKKNNDSGAYENSGLDLEFPDKPVTEKIEEKSTLCGIENPGLDLEFVEKSTPKKKKTKSKDLSNGYDPELSIEYEITQKEKKKKDLKFIQNVYENPALDLSICDRPTPKKCKKNNNEVVTNVFENCALDLDFPDRQTPKKMKKKRDLSNELESPTCPTDSVDYEVSRSVCGLENNALDLSDENPNVKKVTFNDVIEYNTDALNKKKKKKKKLDKYEVVTDRLKKNIKPVVEPVTFVNEVLDLQVLNEEEIENELNEMKIRKCKKKKERRVSVLDTIEEIPEEEILNGTYIISSEATDKNDKDIEFVGEFPNDDIQEIKNVEMTKKKHKKSKNRTKTSEEIDLGLERNNKHEKEIEEIDISKDQKETVSKKKKKRNRNANENLEINNDIENSEKENGFEVDETLVAKCSKEENQTSDNVISLKEFLDEEKIEKTNGNDSSKKNEENISREPEENGSNFQKFMKTKQVMKSLFMKNPTLLFNGSNINEIKGYGSHLYNNY